MLWEAEKRLRARRWRQVRALTLGPTPRYKAKSLELRASEAAP